MERSTRWPKPPSSNERDHSRYRRHLGAAAAATLFRVRAWFEAHDVEQLYLTATVIGELSIGIERIPKGRRRADFERWLEALITEDFAAASCRSMLLPR